DKCGPAPVAQLRLFAFADVPVARRLLEGNVKNWFRYFGVLAHSIPATITVSCWKLRASNVVSLPLGVAASISSASLRRDARRKRTATGSQRCPLRRVPRLPWVQSL